jgi:uncharacterized protein
MSSPQHEPTMEEILASIRKIISEDAPTEAPVQAADSPAPAQIDVLELTQEVIETPQPAPMMAPTPAPEPPPMDDVVFQSDTPAYAPTSNDIFSDHTRKAMDDTFANLPDEEPQPAPYHAPASLGPVSGVSVEEVFERAIRESFEPVLNKYLSDNSAAVIEGVKPVIREWMDEHFPALLEGAVRAEVERVVKARGKR